MSAGARACSLPAAGAGACGCEATAWDGDAQALWARQAVDERLKVLRRARHDLAARAMELAAAISPRLSRTSTDTLTAEVLPLLDACKFLEREAANVLRARQMGWMGRPFWLSGVTAEVRRDALGHVLVIGPANFPLFLPGVQVLQALAAGNRVTWKPGTGGEAVAAIVAESLRASGLPEGLLRVTEASVEAAEDALRERVDKVIVTGSLATGQAVLRGLAETATPAVVELSGADAVFVLPGAELKTVAKAVEFGLRLNGGAVCMSPRRLFADRETMAALQPLLAHELSAVPPVALAQAVAAKMRELVEEAGHAGASVLGEIDADAQKPLLITGATPEMRVTRSDLFAPVLALMTAPTLLEATRMYARCEYALTASIFCGARERGMAKSLAAALKAGTVVINDLIAPTADARLPFGGRGASGYGATRGAEGLLEMTAVKTVIVRRGGSMRHLEPTKDGDAPVIEALIRSVHGGGWRARWQAVRDVMRTGRR